MGRGQKIKCLTGCRQSVAEGTRAGVALNGTVFSFGEFFEITLQRQRLDFDAGRFQALHNFR